jgi:hypothetical protein
MGGRAYCCEIQNCYIVYLFQSNRQYTDVFVLRTKTYQSRPNYFFMKKLIY